MIARNAVLVRWHNQGFSAELVITEYPHEGVPGVLVAWPAEGWLGRARLDAGFVSWAETSTHEAMFGSDLDAILELLNLHKDALPWGTP